MKPQTQSILPYLLYQNNQPFQKNTYLITIQNTIPKNQTQNQNYNADLLTTIEKNLGIFAKRIYKSGSTLTPYQT